MLFKRISGFWLMLLFSAASTHTEDGRAYLSTNSLSGVMIGH